MQQRMQTRAAQAMFNGVQAAPHQQTALTITLAVKLHWPFDQLAQTGRQEAEKTVATCGLIPAIGLHGEP